MLFCEVRLLVSLHFVSRYETIIAINIVFLSELIFTFML